jgi:2-polyprenyl-3-methyl-5-hydroxy-6-metoxy-1,4-benzoquinol methylase
MSQNWKQYFDSKAQTHGASVMSSDYYNEKSFFMQRAHTLSWLGELKGKEVLDAGCGVGAFSEPLVADNTVYGLDFSEESLKFAAQRGLKTMTGDLTNLDIETGRFDVVLCIGVIQLIERYADVVSELARVTKPGGTLLIQTLNRGSIQRKLLKLFEKEKKFERMYMMGELKELFERHGLEQVQMMQHYHPFTFVTTGNGSGGLSNRLCTSFAVKGSKRG